MNTERLNELATMLGNIQQTPVLLNKFHMNWWLQHEVKLRDHSCGTTACAFGYYLLEHPEHGKISDNFSLMEDGQHPINVACVVFDISIETARRLFSPVWYNTQAEAIEPFMVADRVRRLIDNGEDNYDALDGY